MNLLHTVLPAILLSTLPATAVFAETSPSQKSSRQLILTGVI